MLELIHPPARFNLSHYIKFLYVSHDVAVIAYGVEQLVAQFWCHHPQPARARFGRERFGFGQRGDRWGACVRWVLESGFGVGWSVAVMAVFQESVQLAAPKNIARNFSGLTRKICWFKIFWFPRKNFSAEFFLFIGLSPGQEVYSSSTVRVNVFWFW